MPTAEFHLRNFFQRLREQMSFIFVFLERIQGRGERTGMRIEEYVTFRALFASNIGYHVTGSKLPFGGSPCIESARSLLGTLPKQIRRAHFPFLFHRPQNRALRLVWLSLCVPFSPMKKWVIYSCISSTKRGKMRQRDALYSLVLKSALSMRH